jgi:hypothetical protein
MRAEERAGVSLALGAPALLPVDQALRRHEKADHSPSYQAVGNRHGSESHTKRNHLLMWGVASAALRPYANHPPAARGGS